MKLRKTQFSFLISDFNVIIRTIIVGLKGL